MDDQNRKVYFLDHIGSFYVFKGGIQINQTRIPFVTFQIPSHHHCHVTRKTKLILRINDGETNGLSIQSLPVFRCLLLQVLLSSLSSNVLIPNAVPSGGGGWVRRRVIRNTRARRLRDECLSTVTIQITCKSRSRRQRLCSSPYTLRVHSVTV